MLRLITVIILGFFATSTAAFGADDAGIPRGSGNGGVPDGAGYQLGIGGQNNSGQQGFVTLFDRGARTGVVVAVDGANGHVERVELMRKKSCDAAGGTEAVRLSDLTKGISRGYVDFKMSDLTSGKFVTVVYASAAPDAKPVACGELYR
jgi:hypothetical protein